MLKATRCARPVQMLTAHTEAVRSRETVTAAESAASASSPSRAANIPAMESHQFNAQPAMQINPATGKKRTTLRPDRGLAFEEIELTRIAAPAKPRIIARNTAARKKLRSIKARMAAAFPRHTPWWRHRLRGERKRWWRSLAASLTGRSAGRTVARRPMEAAMIHSSKGPARQTRPQIWLGSDCHEGCVR